MYHVSAQGVDERMINVHYNYRGVSADVPGYFKYLLWVAHLSQLLDHQLVVNASKGVFDVDEGNIRGCVEKVDDVHA